MALECTVACYLACTYMVSDILEYDKEMFKLVLESAEQAKIIFLATNKSENILDRREEYSTITKGVLHKVKELFGVTERSFQKRKDVLTGRNASCWSSE